ncbi:MAG: hypothetical protein RLY93_08910 [Sumerlaeia bacterium]
MIAHVETMQFVRDAKRITDKGHAQRLASAKFDIIANVKSGTWTRFARATESEGIWCTTLEEPLGLAPPLYLFYSVSSQTITFHRALLGTT